MKSGIHRSLALLLSVLMATPAVGASVEDVAVRQAFATAAALGTTVSPDAVQTPSTPVFASLPAVNDLAEAVQSAVREAELDATAADVLTAAGFQPGRLSREEVLAAFRFRLSDEKRAALLARFDAGAGVSPTVAELSVAALAGDRYAGGAVMAAAAAVAFLVALSGCAAAPPKTRTVLCESRGYAEMDPPREQSAAPYQRVQLWKLAKESALRACAGKGCANCKIDRVDEFPSKFIAYASGSRSITDR